MSMTQGLCALGNNLYAAWKGEVGDDRLFYAAFTNGVSTATINGIPVGKSDLVNLGADVTTLSSNGVPAGYQLAIALGTDSNSAINSATFSVYDPTSGKTYSKTISPLNQPLDSSLPAALQGPVQETDFAPILAFQLVLVGPDETQVKLSSGAGTITYTAAASSPLTALSAPPSCIKSVTTGEKANSVYSTIAAGTGKTLTQSFWIAG